MPGGTGPVSQGMPRNPAPGGPAQPPPKKKKSRTWLIILLSAVLLLLIACVGGGILYYLNEKNNEAMLESIHSEYRDHEDEEGEDGEGKREETWEAEEETLEEETEEPQNAAAATAGATTAAAATAEATTAAAFATEAATMPETEAVTMPAEETVTVSIQYGSQTSLAGMVKANVQKSTAYDSSHVVQRDSTIDNSAWSAFDGQTTTSWQEGAQGDGVGEYVGISFDREYQVQVITLLLGNHRSDSWYVKNNTPKTLAINLGGQVFLASFPKEKTEFAVVLSRPVAASNIKLTIEEVYKGTEYEDSIIAEVGVYGN